MKTEEVMFRRKFDEFVLSFVSMITAVSGTDWRVTRKNIDENMCSIGVVNPDGVTGNVSFLRDIVMYDVGAAEIAHMFLGEMYGER